MYLLEGGQSHLEVLKFTVQVLFELITEGWFSDEALRSALSVEVFPQELFSLQGLRGSTSLLGAVQNQKAFFDGFDGYFFFTFRTCVI